MVNQTSTSACVAERPPKGPEYYSGLRKEYAYFISGNELIALSSLMEAIATRTISLLTADAKTRKFIAVTRDLMEDALKVLNIGAKVLARISNAMWDIVLALEETVEALAGSLLTTKCFSRMEYMGTRKTRMGGTFWRLLLRLWTSGRGVLAQK